MEELDDYIKIIKEKNFNYFCDFFDYCLQTDPKNIVDLVDCADFFEAYISSRRNKKIGR